MTDLPPASETGDPHAQASWTRAAAGATDLTLEENWLFRLRRERFQSRASGRVHDFYVMYLADAVYAIALTHDDRIVLVRQFRAASMHDSLEAPGGLLEPDEDPRAAGARELLEETGYAGDPATLLCTLWSNPSITTSRTTTIVIRNARRVAEPKLDHSEEVVVELVPVADISRLIQERRIDHALCVAGLLWWLQAGQDGRLS
jgi:8-oxo-dGTP pyrophosphatase MutT (NUDIX family)